MDKTEKSNEKFKEISSRVEHLTKKIEDLNAKVDEIDKTSSNTFIYMLGLTVAIFSFNLILYYGKWDIDEYVLIIFKIVLFICFLMMFYILWKEYKKLGGFRVVLYYIRIEFYNFLKELKESRFLIFIAIFLFFLIFLIFPNKVLNTNQIIAGIDKDVSEIKSNISELRGNISNIEKQLENMNTAKLCIIYPNGTSGSFYINESGCTIICPAK